MPGDVSTISYTLPFDGRHEGFLWAQNCCCHAPDVLIGLVLQPEDEKQSSETLVFKGLYPAFCVRVKWPCLAFVQQDRDYERLVEPVPGGKADGAACKKLTELDEIAMAILIRTSAVLLPSLDMVASKFLKLTTCLSVSPLIVIYALVLFVLFSMVFDISALTSIRMLLLFHRVC
ncbi:hypothetical protein DPMN_041880 [Dreissena polymorpha]|uniref:Uncharacterized protein n=1 Tax=Dreissena polymorpha TaxID=45954 RepID=A0A9D4CXJ8_DREPO|nr:hypothetical protein DPMN_041880 [Dreissena polymorpha]